MPLIKLLLAKSKSFPEPQQIEPKHALPVQTARVQGHGTSKIKINPLSYILKCLNIN